MVSEARKYLWSGLLSRSPFSFSHLPPKIGNRNLNFSPPSQVIKLKMPFTTVSLSFKSPHAIDVLVYA